MHHDMAEISLTLALNTKGSDYRGGDLYFFDIVTSIVVQKATKAAAAASEAFD